MLALVLVLAREGELGRAFSGRYFATRSRGSCGGEGGNNLRSWREDNSRDCAVGRCGWTNMLSLRDEVGYVMYVHLEVLSGQPAGRVAIVS